MSGPYVEGKTLKLTVDRASPHSFIPHDQLHVKIRTIYQPITMSPVMEVYFTSESGDEMEAVLKLFDRRFGIDFRRGRHEWTCEAEAAWQGYVCQGKAPALFRRLEQKELKESAGIFEDSSDNERFDLQSHGATKERLAEVEGQLQRIALKQFATESMAYQKLTTLQGRCIPSVLAHVSISLAPPDLDADDQEYFKIPGILIQLIKGYNLYTELTSKVAREAWGSVVQRVVDAVKMINCCGVINQDCRPQNVVVQQCTLQPYLVDFAICCFREDYESDDEFAYYANSIDNQGAIGAVMARKLQEENEVELEVRYEEMECNINPDE